MKIILIFIFCANIISGFAQSQEVPAFVKKVYDDIFRSMTNGKIKKPVLQVIKDSSKIIYYAPDLNAIFLVRSSQG